MKNLPLIAALLLAACKVSAQVPSYVPAGGLVSWYSFTGNSNDSSGNLNHAAVYGASLTTDRFGVADRAYAFNGISNYMVVPSSSSIDLRNSFSISAWVKATDYTGGSSNYQIFWRGNAASGTDPYMLFFSGGSVRVRRDVGAGTTITETVFPSGIVDVSVWHMITGTYNDVTGRMSIYLDDTLMAQNTLPGTISYGTSAMQNIIGAMIVSGGYDQYFKGSIDDIGLWNTELTYCQVKNMYMAGMNTITLQPSNLTRVSGSGATFSIDDTGTGHSYQWQMNSGSGFINVPAVAPYSGITTKTLSVAPVTALMSGHTYRCIVTDAVCNSYDTSGAAVLTVIPLSVTKINNTGSVRISPNPNNGTFIISSNIAAEIEEVLIYDVLGKVVYRKVVNNIANRHDTEISIDSQLPTGIYVVRLKGEEFSEAVKFQLSR